MGPGSSQVQKIFALLIESGALYSALWVGTIPRASRTCIISKQALIESNQQVLIVAFQISEYVYSKGGSAMSADESRFLGILNVIVHGVLIPAIVRTVHTFSPQ